MTLAELLAAADAVDTKTLSKPELGTGEKTILAAGLGSLSKLVVCASASVDPAARAAFARDAIAGLHHLAWLFALGPELEKAIADVALETIDGAKLAPRRQKKGNRPDGTRAARRPDRR